MDEYGGEETQTWLCVSEDTATKLCVAFLSAGSNFRVTRTDDKGLWNVQIGPFSEETLLQVVAKRVRNHIATAIDEPRIRLDGHTFAERIRAIPLERLLSSPR